MTRTAAVPVTDLEGPLGSCAAAGDELLRAVSILVNGTSGCAAKSYCRLTVCTMPVSSHA
jgi:hypothetical protein